MCKHDGGGTAQVMMVLVIQWVGVVSAKVMMVLVIQWVGVVSAKARLGWGNKVWLGEK